MLDLAVLGIARLDQAAVVRLCVLGRVEAVVLFVLDQAEGLVVEALERFRGFRCHSCRKISQNQRLRLNVREGRPRLKIRLRLVESIVAKKLCCLLDC